jgi:hypothetical protein
METIEKSHLKAGKDRLLSLNTIDASLLCSIIYWLDGYDIAMLWLTGDGILMYLMSEGRAVTHFETNFEAPTHLLRVDFPRLVTSFKGLKELKLSNARPGNHSMSGINFPGTLQFLSLEISRLEEFFSLLRSSSNFLPPLKSLRFIDLSGIMWTDSDLALLPRTLEELHLSQAENLSGVSELPSNLTSLDISVVTLCYDAVKCPPNLTKLVIRAEEDVEDDDLNMSPFIASLPRHIEWLEINDGNALGNCFEVLPPSLTHLKLSTLPSRCATNLASLKEVTPRLTHLSVILLDSIPRSVASLLSPSLKHVELYDFDFSSSLEISFPPNATFVGHSEQWYYHADDPSIMKAINALPRVLTSFSFQSVDPKLISSSFMKALPETLTILKMPTISDEIVMDLPKKLTRLTLSVRAENLATLSETAASQLPTPLEHLSFDFVVVPSFQGWMSRLSKLRELSISSAHFPSITASDVALLPSGFERLDLNSVFPTEIAGKDAWIASMKHLNRLKWFSISTPATDPDILYGLHMRIEDLYIRGITSERPLTNDHLRAIKSLKILKRVRIMGESVCTDESANFLPQGPYMCYLPESPCMSDALKKKLKAERMIRFEPTPRFM